jgi:predicted small secreted protein
MRNTWIFAALAALMALSACNTAAGLGQDVENTGEAIKHTAKDTKKDL